MADGNKLKSLQGKKLGDRRLRSGGKLYVSRSSDFVLRIGLPQDLDTIENQRRCLSTVTHNERTIFTPWI